MLLKFQLSNPAEAELLQRASRAYLILTSLVVVGMVCGMLTAQKVVHIGIDFPFGLISFSILTYPITDCICELWGKRAARDTLAAGLLVQLLLIFLFYLAIEAPGAADWQHQSEFALVLSTGYAVVFASLVAFVIAQLFDIVIFQNIKRITKGKWLWLRTNISVYLGQAIDTMIFVNIFFANLENKWHLLLNILLIKIVISFLMTPIVYLIVNTINRYLNYQTQAFSPSTGSE